MEYQTNNLAKVQPIRSLPQIGSGSRRTSAVFTAYSTVTAQNQTYLAMILAPRPRRLGLWARGLGARRGRRGSTRTCWSSFTK